MYRQVIDSMVKLKLRYYVLLSNKNNKFSLAGLADFVTTEYNNY